MKPFKIDSPYVAIKVQPVFQIRCWAFFLWTWHPIPTTNYSAKVANRIPTASWRHSQQFNGEFRAFGFKQEPQQIVLAVPTPNRAPERSPSLLSSRDSGGGARTGFGGIQKPAQTV